MYLTSSTVVGETDVAVYQICGLYEEFEVLVKASNLEGGVVSFRMGLTISNLFTRLFGKKQMRILMGKDVTVLFLFIFSGMLEI